jgi:hypothetical protein
LEEKEGGHRQVGKEVGAHWREDEADHGEEGDHRQVALEGGHVEEEDHAEEDHRQVTLEQGHRQRHAMGRRRHTMGETMRRRHTMGRGAYLQVEKWAYHKGEEAYPQMEEAYHGEEGA